MKHSYLFGIAAVALTLTACAKNEPAPATKDIVATINGKAVTKGTFEAYAAAAARKPASELTLEQKGQILDQFIGVQLAADNAEKNGLDKTPAVASQLSLARTNVLTDAALKKYMEEHAITEAEMKAEYDTQVAAMGRQYHARHILVDSMAKAETIIDQLKGGADFAKLAEKESSDGSAKQGGDLGWFQLSSMVPPFAQALAALEKGKYSMAPVQTQYGFHVIKLEDTRVQPPPAYDDVKEQVKNLVQRKKLQAYLEELKKTAKIEKSLSADKPEDKSTEKKDAAAPAAPAEKK